MLVKILSPGAKTPTKATTGSAGYDLYSSETKTLAPNSRSLISTGISLEIPTEAYGRIAPRSGLSVRGIDVGAGVVDSDYRGEVKVLLINNSHENFKISPGDRIAQLILEKILNVQVQIVQDLSLTQRNDGGFGSTGV